MVQVIQGKQGLGELLGQGFSTGLGTSLQALAGNKLQQLMQQAQQQKTQKGLEAFGYAPEQAAAYSNFEAPILQAIVKQKLQEPQNKAYGDLAAQLLGFPAGGSAIPSVNNEQVGSEGNQGISGGLKLPENLQVNPKQFNELVKLKTEQEKLGLKKKQAAHEEKKLALQETRNLRQGLEASSKDAKSKLHAISRLEELETEGEGLPTAGYNEFLQNAGLDIPSMLGPQGEEFTKIITSEFQRGAKEIYGGRITNFEMANFIKSIPSLSQSPEGRKRVLENLKYYYNGQRAYNDTKKEIIRENDGVPPLDLDDQIDDRIDSKLEKLSKKFKENLKREVPAAQNPLITAGQALAGKAVKNIPSAFKGAAKGLALGTGIGALGGPIGATGGGILGGLGGLLGLI